VHHQPVVIEFQIFDIQTHQLRPPERPSKSYQNQRPIANVESTVGIEAGDDGPQVLHLGYWGSTEQKTGLAQPNIGRFFCTSKVIKGVGFQL
jgi:hypothetical protein